MIHLIRNTGKIEYLIVDDSKVIRRPIPIPNGDVLEDCIDRLLELHPIIHAGDCVEFAEKEEDPLEQRGLLPNLSSLSSNERVLYTWDVKYDNPISLVSAGNKLKYKTLYQNKRNKETQEIQKEIFTSEGLLLSERVEWVLSRHPHRYPAYSEEEKKESCDVEFKRKEKKQKSAVDGKTALDMNHWCVTLLNAEGCDPCNPYAWMGHALFIIETIEEGGYFARRGDLARNNEGEADVRFFEIPQNYVDALSKKYAKTKTHRRPKEDIQRMIDQVYKDICNQKEGKPSVVFAFDSGRMMESLAGLGDTTRDFPLVSLFQGRILEELPLTNLVQGRIRMNRKALSQEQLDICNCIYYAVDKFSLAKIEDPLAARYVLSKTFWPTPMLYAGSEYKAIAQEASFIAAYSALWSVPASFLGFLIAGPVGVAGPIGALVVGGLGLNCALTDVFCAYKAEADQLQEQKSETKNEEKRT